MRSQLRPWWGSTFLPRHAARNRIHLAQGGRPIGKAKHSTVHRFVHVSWGHTCGRCTWHSRNHSKWGGCPLEALLYHAKLGNLSSHDLDLLKKEVPAHGLS